MEVGDPKGVSTPIAAVRSRRYTPSIGYDGSRFAATERLDLGVAVGLVLRLTTVQSLETNGIAEAFVKMFKCD